MEFYKEIEAGLPKGLKPLEGLLNSPVLLKLRRFFYKLVHYEFWPWWAIFFPLIPMYLYSVVRTGRILYFTTLNPSIPLGGFFGEDKTAIMAFIPDSNKARHKLILSGSFSEDTFKALGFKFPVIVKPNIGERGYMVYELRNMEHLKAYANMGFDFIIQEFLDLPVEAGILYSKLPSAPKPEISSITLKEFMTVIGDGRATVLELVALHPRHFVFSGKLFKKFGTLLNRVPAAGETVEVHRIGNHCLGTRFLSGMDLMGEELLDSVQELLTAFPGFDYGRLDLKVASIEDLKKGKGLKIFELNGISAEPTHMYDQSNVFKAWLILYRHWNRILKISLENMKKGVKPTPFKTFFIQVYNHFMT